MNTLENPEGAIRRLAEAVVEIERIVADFEGRRGFHLRYVDMPMYNASTMTTTDASVMRGIYG